jgi:hypothetical protein
MGANRRHRSFGVRVDDVLAFSPSERITPIVIGSLFPNAAPNAILRSCIYSGLACSFAHLVDTRPRLLVTKVKNDAPEEKVAAKLFILPLFTFLIALGHSAAAFNLIHSVSVNHFSGCG